VGAVLVQMDNGCLLRLEGTVDIASAAEFKTLLLQALAVGRDLDVTAVQLLWAADREARSQGIRVTLSGGCPEIVRRSLAQAGMADLPLLNN